MKLDLPDSRMITRYSKNKDLITKVGKMFISMGYYAILFQVLIPRGKSIQI
jgi:hypothetical protein